MKEILLGNEAIARGLLENGCAFAASYPGTPASEILSSFVRMAQAEKQSVLAEWSINEKVAFETALSISYTGGRAAVSMKQVGLNVASDPLMSSAYTGVKGGFLVISADDPGPHSSQTEQDSRMMAMMAKIPVLDPSTPEEAKAMVARAFQISEAYEIPVMLRPTTRVCHSRQAVAIGNLSTPFLPRSFPKDPQRWAATPRYRLVLHQKLNEKIEAIGKQYASETIHRVMGGPKARLAILSSGVALAHTFDLLQEMGLEERIALYQSQMPYPLEALRILELLQSFDSILVIEESAPVMEMQLARRDRIRGRLEGSIPPQGELIPDVLYETLQNFAGLRPERKPPSTARGRRPTLCPGCGHRAAFYAIRQAFPQGIYPSDIGCYTLGLNLGAVDTCLCMGGAISQAAGFYHAFQLQGEFPPIVATIGDSTFYHAGIPALVNAVHTGARFILMILDNSTTAMTGNQPTPGQSQLVDGRRGQAIPIEDLVRGSGVRHLTIIDPYRLGETIEALKAADEAIRAEGGGVAVVIARRPCVLNRPPSEGGPIDRITVTEDCLGCGICVEDFECPAIAMDPASHRATIDETICSGCGVCLEVCPQRAIIKNS